MMRTCIKLLCIALGLGVAAKAGAMGPEGEPAQFYAGLTEGDLSIALAALQETLETRRSNEMNAWRDGATGIAGSIVPLRTFRIETGVYCRDYRETILAGGHVTARALTACRDGDGRWIPVAR